MGREAQQARRRRPTPHLPELWLAPLWIWIGITTAWMLCYCAYGALFIGSEFFDATLWAGWGVTVFQDALLVGYLPAATVWGQRQGVRVLRALQPVLDMNEQEALDCSAEISSLDSRILSIGVGVALVVGVLLSLFNFGRVANDPLIAQALMERLGFSMAQGELFYLEIAAWEMLSLTVIVMLIWIFISSEAQVPRRLSILAGERARLDLIDLSSFAPLTEHGLGGAMRVIGVAVAASVGLLVVPEDLLVVVALVLAPLAAFVALRAPVRRIHDRIESEKKSLLARIRRELSNELRSAAGDRGGRIADWIAYEQRIEAVYPWLYDNRALLRFGIIVGAGVSMLGGALVERLVDAILG